MPRRLFQFLTTRHLQPSCDIFALTLQAVFKLAISFHQTNKQTMHKRLSLISVWVATCLMLLSTVVMHHHHYERACIVAEHCEADASGESEPEAEEGHSHQETDRESCRMHQLHRFIINDATARDIRRHIADGVTLAATLNESATCPTSSSIAVRWIHTTTPTDNGALYSIFRRGPPLSSL